MKVTIEIPDKLHRRIKAKCSREGRTVRGVTEELCRGWLAEGPTPAAKSPPTPSQWLKDWIAMADKTMRDVPPSPTARDLLAEHRKRLERP